MQESKTSNGGDGTERVALPYKQAVEIATGGSGVGSFEQFDSLGLTASQITRVSNGTYRGPNGRPIKTVEAEAIIAKADPDVYRLSPEAVANIRYNLDSLAQGKLPIGIKRDFNKSLAQQAQEERAVLEAQLALSDAIDARDADVRVVARERSEIAQKKLEREDEGVLQRELRRVEAETYQKSLDATAEFVEEEIAKLKGDPVERHHKAEHIRMQARKVAREAANNMVEHRRREIQALGGSTPAKKLLETEQKEKEKIDRFTAIREEREAEEAEARRKAEAREARAAKKAAREEEARRKFKEHIGSGGIQREQPRPARKPIIEGESPKKPSHIDSRDWWAMSGDERRLLADRIGWGNALKTPDEERGSVSDATSADYDALDRVNVVDPSSDNGWRATDLWGDDEGDRSSWLKDLYEQHQDDGVSRGDDEDDDNPFAHLPPPPSSAASTGTSDRSGQTDRRRGRGFWNRRNRSVATAIGSIAIVAGVAASIVSGAFDSSRSGEVSATTVQLPTTYNATGTTEVNIGGVLGGEGTTATTEIPGVGDGSDVSQFSNSVSVQKVAIRTRARELGVRLSGGQVDRIVAARANSLFTGPEENLRGYQNARPEQRLIVSDAEILNAARQG